MVHLAQMLIQRMRCRPVLWEKQGDDFTNFWKILLVCLEAGMQNQKHSCLLQDQVQQHVHQTFSQCFRKQEDLLILGIYVYKFLFILHI